jgi:hypothetical protein
MMVNAKIEKVGLYYNGHYRHYSLRIELKTRGGGASIELPLDRTPELMEMFEADLYPEDGVFVGDLKGVPVVLKLDGDNEYQGRIVAIGSILANEDEMLYI